MQCLLCRNISLSTGDSRADVFARVLCTNCFTNGKSEVNFESIVAKIQRHPRLSSGAFIIVFAIGMLLWPVGPLFPVDYSRVVYDHNGALLRVTCAQDDQIRFRPDTAELPKKYVTALTAIEDKRFFKHPGVDPLALAAALISNIRAGTTIRGGSTIPMQIIRLAHPRPRTYASKIIECIAAIRLTLQTSKKEQIKLYAAHAPMGGNVVGIRAASYYYFGKTLEELTWSEAALFTVLPNNPSLMNMHKKRAELKAKRNRALAILRQRGHIDSLTCALASAESLPRPQSQIPFEAPHFAEHALSLCKAHELHTTLDKSMQHTVECIVGRFTHRYRRYGVHNCAALIIDTRTNEVKAYVGSNSYRDTVHAGRVDGVTALRSSGSLLKPLLVARALDRGPWVLQSQLQDIPSFYGTFAPSNASEEFQGIVTIKQMLVQSLNVPAVRLLYEYGQPAFYHDLQQAGISSLFRSAGGYGLSLILGGAEVSLWEMCRTFCALGNNGIIKTTSMLQQLTSGNAGPGADSLLLCSPGAAWMVSSALSKLKRPESERYWRLLPNRVRVAWKTGTSYGQKDAWAIGVNAQWTIGVWTGNFSGEGNAFLGGAVTAGPVLFSLFRALTDPTQQTWSAMPEYDLKRINVCASTGYPPGPNCPKTTPALQPANAWKTSQCRWHRSFHLDRSTGYEVCSKCWKGIERIDTCMLIYPAPAAEILRARGRAAPLLPPHNPTCTAVRSHAQSVVIEYPVNGISIFVPRDIHGKHQRIVAKASSTTAGTLFWYLDGRFAGETREHHTPAFTCAAGMHKLSAFTMQGDGAQVKFKVAVK
ncbi:MAG: penicillin-binding protein 1C [Chitinivibrionales bacterium]|nr:penicillin-binding protein 1C [Chitinivibrionales bacterium]